MGWKIGDRKIGSGVFLKVLRAEAAVQGIFGLIVIDPPPV
jgi:hypothetical protein